MGFQHRVSVDGNYTNGLPRGYSKLGAWKSWNSMKVRCMDITSNRWEMYGGRGVKVCDEWLKFVNFYRDMGDRPKGMTIDRIDSNGNYCKENCKWSTPTEQSNNTRRNTWIEFNGKNKTISEWSRELGISGSIIMGRLYKLKWPIEKVLTSKKYGNKHKTHCRNGHELIKENCYPSEGKNTRQCKLCHRKPINSAVFKEFVK